MLPISRWLQKLDKPPWGQWHLAESSPVVVFAWMPLLDLLPQVWPYHHLFSCSNEIREAKIWKGGESRSQRYLVSTSSLLWILGIWIKLGLRMNWKNHIKISWSNSNIMFSLKPFLIAPSTDRFPQILGSHCTLNEWLWHIYIVLISCSGLSF